MYAQEEVMVPEKRRVAKSAVFVLISIMFKRYSTAAISCKKIGSGC